MILIHKKILKPYFSLKFNKSNIRRKEKFINYELLLQIKRKYYGIILNFFQYQTQI